MEDKILLTYHNKSPNNWGDYIAPVICKYITGKGSVHVAENSGIPERNYAIIGSILGWLTSPSVVVWGCGFITEEGRLQGDIELRAVRGKLTRDIILKQGYSCPEIYGDPVLLLPRYYNPKVEKKYKLGVIPHYVDKEVDWVKNPPEDVKMIDVCGDSHEFIDEVISCEMIASSSLHGLVVADAYSIPNIRIKLSDNVGGGSFKFRDYFSSVKRQDYCITIDDGVLVSDIISSVPQEKIDIDLDLYMSVCPLV